MSRVRTLVTSQLLFLVGLAFMAALVFCLEPRLKWNLSRQLSTSVALCAASAPILLFIFSHRLGTKKWQSTRFLRAIIGGAFVAGPCAGFAMDFAATPSPGLFPTGPMSAESWIYAVAIVGIAQETSKYFVFRFGVLTSEKPLCPVDQIQAMIAVATGFASYQSYHFLLTPDGNIVLSIGLSRVINNALLHTAVASLLGFALAFLSVFLVKRSAKALIGHALFVVSALLATAILNACFSLFSDKLGTYSLQASPWPPLVLSFGIAALLLLLLFYALRKLPTLVRLAPEVPVAPVASPQWRFLQLLLMMLLFAGAIAVHRQLSLPTMQGLHVQGLQLERPVGWFRGQPKQTIPLLLQSNPRLHSPAQKQSNSWSRQFTSPYDSRQRIFVEIDSASNYPELHNLLALRRVAQFGEMVWISDSRAVRLGPEKRSWLRSEYRHAFKASGAEAPSIAYAIEYAKRQNGLLYIVTIRAEGATLEALDKLVAPTLTITNDTVGQHE